ncbi:MAG: DUF4097 family beta strand repeat-containing protein [Clostridiaceae bacterium]|nr:DUF4097 family beta strand repeat-containing protein [Clostridiaceae bacterium]
MKKTMKTLAVIAAVLLSLGLIVCVGAMATTENGFRDAVSWFTTPLFVSWDNNTHRLRVSVPEEYGEPASYDFTAAGAIREIVIETVSPRIRLVPTAGIDRMRVHYTERYDGQFIVAEDGGTLRITQDAVIGSVGLDFQSLTEEIIIEYPSGTALDALTIESVNGSVDIGALTAKTVRLGGTNGGVHLSELTANTVVYASVNGSLTGTLTCDSLTANTTNGGFTLALDARSAEFAHVNADIKLTLAGSPGEYALDYSAVNTDLEFNGRDLDAGQYTFTADGRPIVGVANAARVLRISGTNGGVSLETVRP